MCALPTARLCTLLVALALSMALPAHALPVIVPDHFPTIQLAIDSGADEILVRPGFYFETPSITRPLSLGGLVPAGTAPDSLPVIAGLSFDDLTGGFTHTQYTILSDLRFSRVVENTYTNNPYSNPYVLYFSRCVLDSGVTDVRATVGGQLEYELHRCTLKGMVQLGYPDRIWLDSCDVRQPIVINSHHSRPEWFTVTRSRVTGAGPIGIDIRGSVDNVIVRHSSFEGYQIPLKAASVEVEGNTFTGPGLCAVQATGDGYFGRNRVIGYEVGFQLGGGDGNGYAFDNRIENCSVAGVLFDVQYAWCRRDTILACGVGMSLKSTDGIIVESNRILGSAGDGISVETDHAVIDSNVVGRSGGDGISANLGSGQLRRNTSYLNSGSGYAWTLYGTSSTGDVNRNIGFDNGRYGFECVTSGTVTLGCNDWFANHLGAVVGAGPSATDLAVDPRFCDLTNDDAHLAADSPLANASGCGLIGALEVGCGPTAAVGDESANSRGFALAPIRGNPGSGPFTIRFTTPGRAAVDVQVFDLQGRRTAHLASGVWPAGTHAVEWSGRDASGRAATGLHLVRYRFPDGDLTQRVFIVR